MTSAEEVRGVKIFPDSRVSSTKNVNLTLSAGVVHVITRPRNCRGFRLTTTLTDVLFAIDENPDSALTASSSASVVESDFGVGNLASSSEREVRIMEGSDLRIESATGGVVLVEFFS